MQKKGFKKRDYEVQLRNGKLINVKAKSLRRAKKEINKLKNKNLILDSDNLTSKQIQEIRITLKNIESVFGVPKISKRFLSTIEDYNRTHKNL